jgi:asparagine synthase (glutamine-hydrolysing)
MNAQVLATGNAFAVGAAPDWAHRPVVSTAAWSGDGRNLTAIGEVTLYNRYDYHSAHAPAGTGDLELLLEAYAREGMAAFARADGMFALAIIERGQLLLVRDPVGCRTVFYATAAGGVGASTSLRALCHWLPRSPVISLGAVRSFLTFAYLPGSDTLIEGIREVLPGTSVRLTLSGPVTTESYWEPAPGEYDPNVPISSSVERVATALDEAIVRRLPAAEDAGVYLSGGLDSSLVTALAARRHRGVLRTYAISFGSDLPNELAYSDLVANHCQTRHRVLSFDGRHIASHLEEAVARLDTPVGDPLTVPNLLLGRAAAADGLEVILNGEGGDPVFGGPKNLPMLVFDLQRQDPRPAARTEAYLRAYRKCYEDLDVLLSDEVLSRLDTDPGPAVHVEELLHSRRFPSYLDRLMYTNIRTKGAHHILTKVERLTASCGLEGRSPLFAKGVVEASFAVPPHHKLDGTADKWVLKRAADRLLPPLIVHRPKSGMRVPVQAWLRGPLRRLANELLFGRRARERNLFRESRIRAWLDGGGSLYPRQGGKVWLVLTLELWLRQFVD